MPSRHRSRSRPQSTETDVDPLIGLVDDLKCVVRPGLPLQPGGVPGRLLDLDGVIARSVRSDDVLARTDALDRLLRATIKLLTPPERREAAELLFIVSRAGRTLTQRRLAAATALDYEPHHFRKRIEPTIIRDIAWQLHRDSLQYVSRTRDDAPFEASGATPIITEEHIIHADTAEREVLLSRIWSHVYGLRAELIAREASRDDPAQEATFKDAAAGSLWYLARLLSKLASYSEKYGKAILHGDAEYNVDSLIRLAGWTGEITTEEARELRFALAQAGESNRATFLAYLTNQDQ